MGSIKKFDSFVESLNEEPIVEAQSEEKDEEKCECGKCSKEDCKCGPDCDCEDCKEKHGDKE